jgi:REP element-mobilizing transposase RayT
VNWIPGLGRKEYKEIFLESLKYCQENKGLEVYAWVLMDNHVHMVLGRNGEEKLEDIVRDIKKYTSVHICRAIEANLQESRRELMLWMFERAGKKSGKHKKYMFWQEDYHPIELSNHEMTKQKIYYIHENPVKEGIVFEEEHYMYSSAIDYKGKKGKLDVLLAW